MSKKDAGCRGGAADRRLSRRDLIGGLFSLASAPLLATALSAGPATVGIRGVIRARRLETLRPRRTEGLQTRPGPEAGELELKTSTGAHLCLNETAAEILSLCDGQRDLLAITRELAASYGEVPLHLRSQVADTLVLLLRAGAIS